jgi:hypothetical protein
MKNLEKRFSWTIWVGPIQSPGSLRVDEGGVSERTEDAVLVALKIEGGTMRQERWGVSGKSKGMISPLGSSG